MKNKSTKNLGYIAFSSDERYNIITKSTRLCAYLLNNIFKQWGAFMADISTRARTNIHKKDINLLLGSMDITKPTMLVILDDSGIPDNDKGKEYVKRILSNPSKLGSRCIVTSNCHRFISYATEFFGDSIKVVNSFLLKINKKPNANSDITMYILPSFSCSKTLQNIWKILWHSITKKLILGLGALGLLTITIIDRITDSDKIIQLLTNTINLSESLIDKFLFVLDNMTLIIWCLTFIVLFIKLLRNLDKKCIREITHNNDNVLFVFNKFNIWSSLWFWFRWIYANKLNKNNRAYYICTKEPPLREAFQFPAQAFLSKRKPEDCFRFLLALQEHWNAERGIGSLNGYF